MLITVAFEDRFTPSYRDARTHLQKTSKSVFSFDDICLFQALYDLPDQIIGAESVPGGLTSTNVEVFEDMDEVTTTMGLSVGIEYTPGAFTLTPSFNFAHTTFSNSSRYIEEVQAHVAAFRF